MTPEERAREYTLKALERIVIELEKTTGNINTDGKPVCYCHYDIELGFHIDVNTYISTGSYIRPATREQRDTLIKAMSDAGYAFDFDKKELKRIKQKTAEEYNITGIHSKHAEGKLGEMIKNLKSVNEMKVEPKFKVKYAGSEYNVLEVKDIAGVTFYGIEDEPNHIDYIKAENCERVEDEIEIPYGYKDSELQEATYYIPKGFYAEIDDDKVVIKKGEKPTEWSEEDEAKIVKLKSFIAQCRGFNKENRNKAFDLIDSIKLGYTWKPSDEQMNTLEYYMHTLICNEHKEVLFGLYADLKKLKE